MASKNLGAVIQRAISDGAFRRQLQSDPAAALRGFNLSPDEIAAVRSGDSSKLMSLGVDQRMSKAFSISGTGSSAATRGSMSGDISGSTSNTLAGDNTAGAREGLANDPTSGARATVSAGQSGQTQDMPRAMADSDNTTGAREAYTTGDQSGARAGVTTPQGDAYRAVNDPDNTGGTRETVSDPTSAGTRSTLTGGQQDSYRGVNDPDNTGGTRETVTGGQQDSFRAINDPDNTGGTRETLSAGQQDSFRAINDPDNTGATSGSSAVEDSSSPEFAAAHGSDSDSLASRMQDANTDASGGDIQHDPGFVDTHNAFIPSDSADVQRELIDGTHGTGDALGNTGHTGIDS